MNAATTALVQVHSKSRTDASTRRRIRSGMNLSIRAIGSISASFDRLPEYIGAPQTYREAGGCVGAPRPRTTACESVHKHSEIMAAERGLCKSGPGRLRDELSEAVSRLGLVHDARGVLRPDLVPVGHGTVRRPEQDAHLPGSGHGADALPRDGDREVRVGVAVVEPGPKGRPEQVAGLGLLLDPRGVLRPALAPVPGQAVDGPEQ